MILNYFLLATSVSIDSLGIGITYGLRKTKLTFLAKFVLFAFSFIVTSISIYLGSFIASFLPSFFTKLIGTILLISMGIWVIYQSVFSSTEKKRIDSSPKIHQIFFKSLGITIQIIRDPITSDFDQSHLIDAKEALYLAFALSIDSICVGIGSSFIGANSLLFPFLVSIFQLLFLSLGGKIGEKVSTSCHLPENIWSILSGSLLIFIGFSRLFI